MTSHDKKSGEKIPRLPAPSAPTGRLAPSPTGRLHLGNAYAFLAAWLSIRSQGGRLILRMEDIDPDRSRPEHARGILEDLAWLGLDWDAGPEPEAPLSGPCVQSRRMALYEEAIAALQSRALTYPCFCTRKELRTLASAPHVGDEGAPYPGLCRRLTPEEQAEQQNRGRTACLRLRTDAPGFSPRFTDLVRGVQNHSLEDCGGDFAVRRSDGVIAYQLAVVVDDADMGVTEVVRGEDLLLSTPRQLLLFHLLGKTPPAYAHLPLMLDHQGMRLAKRHKALELRALRESAISPRAVIGYIASVIGLLDSPRPISPAELLPGFRLAALAGRTLRLPENVMAALRMP